jgi:endo-1,4-beta-xylanase
MRSVASLGCGLSLLVVAACSSSTGNGDAHVTDGMGGGGGGGGVPMATGGTVMNAGGTGGATNTGSAVICSPGDTRLCVGPGACSGGQLCVASGTWTTCDCGSAAGGAGAGGAGAGGQTFAGGATGAGGTVPAGGTTGAGAAAATGGFATGGGATSTGGSVATGGVGVAGGGRPTGTGGIMPATGGSKAATGGSIATGGKAATGGSIATGGAAAGGDTSVNCSATMPTGGTPHTGNSQGTAGGFTWSLSVTGSGGSITTYGAPAFSASWGPSSGDFLARIGLEWGGAGKTYDQYGTISAQFSYTKTGSGGGYSYIGIYGWSNSPCVEYYIVDDSYGTMPFDVNNATLKGTVAIDGQNYKLFQNTTNGTGSSRCGGGATSWLQFWSIRQKARQCGTISITQHFDAWKNAGMALGSMLEAKIFVAVGGGTGTINFPVANVTAK